MIYVHRPTDLFVPASLRPYDPRVQAAMARAREHFSAASTGQERFEFDAEIWRAPDVIAALQYVFGGKCAYCESVLDEREMRGVDHFRPTANTKDPRRKRAYRDRYYWLAYEWTNLYAACRTCARNRANQFAIKGKLAAPEETGPALAKERPLLLDPCADAPEEHLLFRRDGQVISPGISTYGRGEYTIQTLGLGRSDLVAARRQAADETYRRMGGKLGPQDPRKLAEMFRDALGERLPYLAVRRTVLTRNAIDQGWDEDHLVAVLNAAGLGSAWVRVLWARVATALEMDAAALAEARRAPRSQPPPVSAFRPPQEDAGAVEADAPAEEPAARGAYVERIEIRNFRAIRELVLDVPRQAPEDLEEDPAEGADKPPRQPWLALLGENGTGKSSVLQALAYALMGEERLKAVLPNPGRILRRPPRTLAGKAERAPRKGRVCVQLSTHTIEFTFTSRTVTWHSGREGAGVFLRGYGSTRLLPAESGLAPRADDPPPLVRIDNLFDPFEPLNDAEAWFARLGRAAGRPASTPRRDTPAWRARQKFDAAALALKDLLPAAGGRQVVHDPALGMVLLDQEGVAVPLHELSDGYQTVIALAADIMAGVPDEESDFATRAGIVLLDELGTHLHPRWRMEIVKGLRSAFPSLQFIATTHEPLCLRGLGKGEVVVMVREEGVMRTITSLPSPRGLRVDQLLTSRFFGLHTTIEPRLDQEFQEYYDLLSRRDTLNAAEARRLEELKLALEPHRVLGYTRRDQLVAEALDDYFARERGARDPAALREETRRRLADIWRRVSVPAGIAP